MTPRLTLTLAGTMVLALATGASAQGTKMTLRPESNVIVAGGSNLHDWSCKSSGFQATIELDSGYVSDTQAAVSKPINKVVVTIPTKSLKCGKDKMDANTYKALRANEFPEIRYELSSYKVDPAKSTLESFAAITQGDLTVAGTTKRVEIPVTGTRDGGRIKGTGTLRMLMTDVGIKPPTALLGTLRTKNEIEISFEVLLDKAVVVALQQQ